MKKILAVMATLLIVVVSFFSLTINSDGQKGLSAPLDIGKAGYSTTGRDLLDKKAQKNYDKISESIYKLQSPVKSKSTTPTKVKQLMEYFKADNPQVFWLNNDFGYKYNFVRNDVASINLDYYYTDMKTGQDVPFTPEMVESMSYNMEQQAKSIIAKLRPNSSDYEKAKFFHDYLISNVSYDESSNFQHTSYGALVDRKAVCDGLSAAYSYLLALCDIESSIAYGISSGNVFHAWNIVKLDGEYYHTDLTWDMPSVNDDSGIISYANFNITDEQILETREIRSPFIGEDSGKYPQYLPIPHCTATKYNYYQYNGQVIHEYNDVSLDKLFDLLDAAIARHDEYIQVQFAEKEYMDTFINDVTSGTKRNFYRFPYTNDNIETSIKTIEKGNIIIFGFKYL